MNSTYMSVDPGIRGTGVILWDSFTWGQPHSYPIKIYSLEPRFPDSDWVAICADMHKTLEQIIERHNVVKVYCEYPQYFSSDIGHAATTDGKIYKLASFIGLVMGTVFSNGGKFYPIEVIQWKGQMTKEAVEKRLKRRLPEWEVKIPKIKTHCWDALGVGMFAQGRF